MSVLHYGIRFRSHRTEFKIPARLFELNMPFTRLVSAILLLCIHNFSLSSWKNTYRVSS